jgi:hypothetical protein
VGERWPGMVQYQLFLPRDLSKGLATVGTMCESEMTNGRAVAAPAPPALSATVGAAAGAFRRVKKVSGSTEL